PRVRRDPRSLPTRRTSYLVRLGTHLDPLGRHDLDRFTGMHRLDDLVYHLVELGLVAAPGELRLRTVERHRGRRGVRVQLPGHLVQPAHAVVVRGVDTLRRVVPVHRVGDERDRALVVDV